MIGYVTLGSNDKAKAIAFYDELLSLVGAKQFLDAGHLMIWGTEPGQPMLAVGTPYDEQPATVGNGTMVALAMKDKAMVDAFYQKALALGASDEGEPGMRTDTFYGAYFRDLDGNKLCAFCMAK